MGKLEDSMKRHPAGVLRKKAEESPHSLGWALGMAKVLGERAERDRIIKLWELEMACECEDAMGHLKQRIEGEKK